MFGLLAVYCIAWFWTVLTMQISDIMFGRVPNFWLVYLAYYVLAFIKFIWRAMSND